MAPDLSSTNLSATNVKPSVSVAMKSAGAVAGLAKRPASALPATATQQLTSTQKAPNSLPAAVSPPPQEPQNVQKQLLSSTPHVANVAEPAQPRVFSVEDDESLSPFQHMAAGALAGMTEHMAMFPVDTIKTRMQSYVGLRDFGNLGMMNTTRAIISTDGIAALWRGVGAVAISAGPAHALYFSTYEAVRKVLAPTQKHDGDVHPAATAVAGACATIIADGIMTPLDVVKQRMQLTGRSTYQSVIQCTRHVYTNHGIPAFFAGYRATLLMNIPFTAVYFSGYESAKKLVLDYRGVDDSQFSATSHCLAGALAGAAAAASTNPLDVVKTRLQTQGEVGARRYRGLLDALRSIRVEEGWRGLMSGVRPRVLFHMPAAAVCWTTYEFCKHIMYRTGTDAYEASARR